MEVAPESWPSIITWAIVILAVIIAVASFASIGLVHGLNALRAMRGHSNAPSLRLAALNLLEPSVMIILGLTFVAISYAFPFAGVNILVWSAVAVILQSLMLLAPLFAPATLPFRNAIAVWGGLRWINALLLWAAVYLSRSEFQNVIYVLLVTGIAIWWLSVNKIVAILRELRVVKKGSGST